MIRLVSICFVVQLMFACSSNSDDVEKENKKDSIECIMPLPDTTESAQMFTDGLELFQNMEQIVYCVPIPSKEYVIDENEELERGQFLFRHKSNKKLTLSLKGLFRSDTTVKLAEYFKNSYTEQDELDGKIITEKKMVEGTHCFYAKGYMNNLMYEQRFLEITWLREEDVVLFSVDYDIKDTLLWNNRMKQFLSIDSKCK